MAAEEMRLTQSAVSQRMRNLESEFGVLLFDRSKRSPSLTQAGEIVVMRTQEILRIFDSIRPELSQPSLITGHITIGATPSILDGVLPRVLLRISRRHPNLRITVRSGSATSLHSHVTIGEVDYAITSLPCSQSSRLVVHPLFDEPLWLVSPPRSEQLSIRELIAQTSLIRQIDEEAITEEVDAELRHLDIVPEHVMLLDQPAAIVQLIRRGVGAAILTMVNPSQLIESGLTCLPFGKPQLRKQLVLIERLADANPQISTMLTEELKRPYHQV